MDQFGPETPLVSVVVPVYNTQRFLPRCVNSLLAQTWSRLEVILVDDGSGSACAALCDELAQADARVRVIHRDNGGLSVARNTGLAASSGNWVVYVDSDDWVHRQAVERLLLAARTTDSDVAVGGFSRVPSGEPADFEQPFTFPVQCTTLSGDQALAASTGSDHTLLTIACGKLIRRTIALAHPFPPGRIHEDEFTTYKLLHAAQRVAILREPLYYYRQHAASITGQGFNLKGATDVIDAYRERLAYLTEAGLMSLVGVAEAQLFRKELSLYRRLPPGRRTERSQLFGQLTATANRLWKCGNRGAFAYFAALTVRVPRLAIPLYELYDSMVNARRRAS